MRRGEFLRERQALYRVFPPGMTGGEGAILIQKGRPRWIYANRISLEILEEYAGRRSVEQTSREIALRYGIDLATARKDVRALLEKLERAGFAGTPPALPRRIPSLSSVFLHITSRCNLSCVHCYYPPTLSRTPDLPGSKILNLVEECADLGGTSVAISGGEPLLHADLRRILPRACERLDVQLLTNGTLIDDEWAAYLAGLPLSIQVSLDGPTQEINDAVRGSGTFDRTRRAIDRMQAAGLNDRLVLATTMVKANIPHLEEMTALARELGIPRIRFLPLQRTGNAARNWGEVGSKRRASAYRDFYRAVLEAPVNERMGLDISCGLAGFVPFRTEEAGADDLWCPVGRKVSVTADGKAYPCPLLMNDEYLLGNVHVKSLAQILRSRPMARACRIVAERRTAIPKCARCLWTDFCQAGCMGLALDQRGEVWDTDVFCADRKKAYAAAFDKILERASSERSPNGLD